MDVPLTVRQTQVLTGLLAGKPFKEIARNLHIALKTAKHHATLLYQALDVDGRDQAAELYGDHLEPLDD